MSTERVHEIWFLFDRGQEIHLSKYSFEHVINGTKRRQVK